MQQETLTIPATDRTPPARAILAATLGNAFEWYDFIVYGLFASSIAKAFFPAQTELRSLLLTVATFGVGFVARPVGAIVLGGYADRAGRGAALTLIMVLMTLGTALVAATPGYASIGVWAPLLVVAGRLIQGFSVGGDIGGATALMIEAAPAGRRNLYTSLQMVGQFAATLAGVSIGSVLSLLFSQQEIAQWAWRIPFFVGLLIGPIGAWIRATAIDAAEFRAASQSTGSALNELARNHLRDLATAFGLTVLGTIATYVLIVHMPAFAIVQLRLSFGQSYTAVAIGAVLGLVTAPIAGGIGDRHGSRRLTLVSCLALGVASYPLFLMIVGAPRFATLVAFEAILSVLVSVFIVSGLAVAVQAFPPRVRSTGLAIGYSVGVAIFGGFGPLIATWLVAATGNQAAPALFVIGGAVVTLATLVSLKPGRPGG